MSEPDLAGISEHSDSPSVVFARDVIHHQPAPLDFMAKLLSMPTEAAILRFRTRDHGATVTDPEISCQWLVRNWVPYIILNVDEVIETIRNTRSFTSLSVLKHYHPLGGRNGRYLPKECYDPKTGTAQTSVYVHFAGEPVQDPSIEIGERVEPKVHPTLLWRGKRWLRNRISHSK